ncbi:hypothetical protein DRI50_05335 [candidate division KSB1 bacterium]|nr:MAG: hypothetical protein DRI50_05335 [candidate division KSB1 bacterium]
MARRHFHWNFWPGAFWGFRGGPGPWGMGPWGWAPHAPSKEEELAWLKQYRDQLKYWQKELEDELKEVEEEIAELEK